MPRFSGFGHVHGESYLTEEEREWNKRQRLLAPGQRQSIPHDFGEQPLTDAQRRRQRVLQEADEDAVKALKDKYEARAAAGDSKNRTGLSSAAEQQRLQQQRDELEKLERRKSLAALRKMLHEILKSGGVRTPPQAHHATSPPHTDNGV